MEKSKADIILIGCVNGKHNRKNLAKDLYDSSLWNFRREYVEQHSCPWYILSAKHRLLRPDKEIEPYDCTLSRMSAARRHKWSQNVLAELVKEIPMLRGRIIEIHAGKEYVEYGLEEGLRKAGADVRRPL